MKRMILFFTGFVLAAITAFAQPGAQPTGIDGSLLRMFGDTKHFSALGEVRLTDAAGKEISTIPLNMALLDGKLRTEMDISQMKSSSMSSEAAAGLKSMGMDRMQTLILPNTQSTLIIYPGLQAYATVKDEKATTETAKVETTEVAKETVDGHPCVKKKLTVTEKGGKTQEAFVWAATDLKDFPVRMQMKQENTTVNIHFKSPSLEKPDARLFEPPAGYAKHDSIQGLMQAAMMKMIGGAK